MSDIQKSLFEYFTALDRSLFMEFNKVLAPLDSALPIGYGQTISQPSLVLKMTMLLELTPSCRTLEIGTGSGYQTALLSRFSKHVYTVERIEALQEKAIERLSRLGYKNISYKLGDGTTGWEKYAPYDRIMVTASASRIPPHLIEQLAPGGKMVIPVGPDDLQALYVLTKDKEGICTEEFVCYVRFVRLIGEYE